MVKVSDSRIYVVQAHQIFIYERATRKLLTVAGKEGPGPGEFQLDPSRSLIISLQGSELWAESRRKRVVYSADGVFLREEPKPPSVLQALNLGPNLLLFRIDYGAKDQADFVLEISDPEGKPIRELARQPFFMTGTHLRPLPDAPNFCLVDNEIWVEKSTEGFCVDRFDRQGTLLGRINLPHTPLNLRDQDKKEAWEQYLKIPSLQRLKAKEGEAAVRQFLSGLTLVWPRELPPIRHIQWDGERLWVQTHDRTPQGDRFVFLDRQGKVCGEARLPSPQDVDLLVALQGDKRYFTCWKGIYCTLRSADDTEGEEYWYLDEQEIQKD